MSKNQSFQFALVTNIESAVAPAKFRLGDRVRWFRVPTQDFGTVVNCFYSTEGSVQALGWHYLIQLDPRSSSFTHCKFDLGFEDDLAVLELEKDGDAIESYSD